MNIHKVQIALALAIVAGASSVQAIDRYVSLSGSHSPPFTDWAGAATNIQAAIDVASAGDTIWVTNGVYNTGGKVMYGDLTNRVALDKAVTVQSLGGPGLTTILGAWDAATNGPAAVRCAWLTNGAVLSGFTLRKGATRSSGDGANLASGGGVWGASTNDSSVLNCIIKDCSAATYGGGAYGAGLANCRLIGNVAWAAGGGAYNCELHNCWITRCSASTSSTPYYNGGGAYGCTLVNCTINFNTAIAVRLCTLVNSIVYFNPGGNYVASTLSYCCTSPSMQGAGNISKDPLFMSDGLHLSPGSPCRGVGLVASASGNDIDGQLWASPPSMGCDEWCAQPLVTIPPTPRAIGKVDEIWLTGAAVAGETSSFVGWLKDGEVLQPGGKYLFSTTNLVVRAFDVPDVGAYQFVVSNQYGFSTSSVFQLAVHCADAAAADPKPPFNSWNSAALTLQDAINASADGDVVLVTNGVYNIGGVPAPARGLTNRVFINKAIPVLSVNGPAVTTIQGSSDPVTTTNGPLAVRCVYLGTNASLNGFTLTGGATLASSGYVDDKSGGGIFGTDASAMAVNCNIQHNSGYYGGGSSGGSLINCVVVGNSGFDGGGLFSANAANTLIRSNVAYRYYGGFVGGNLVNCTVTGNRANLGFGGGIVKPMPPATPGTLRNSIVFGDTGRFGELAMSANDPIYFSCSPQLSGNGNTNADPQLVDGIHIATTSPCRGAADPLYATGTDLDGNPWANPSSMGCFEVWEDQLVGPLSVGLTSERTEVAAHGVLALYGEVVGKATRVEWDFADGTVRTNAGCRTSYAWTDPGDYTVLFTVFNNDHLEGVSAVLRVHVIPLAVPALAPTGLVTNNFTLSFPTQWGVPYIVEQATNLAPPVSWTTVTNFTGADGVQQVTDPYATNSARFYRVRVP